MIAALYVANGGCYFGLDGVDPWDERRDARRYAGPHPVVAHPPCQRWGRYWHGGPMLAGTPRAKKLGDDGGCFAAALDAVRRWGGVLEHPAYSHAWKWHDIARPPHTGGWVRADDRGGFTCHVEQGHYGHRARKATWLYACGVPSERLPDLKWGPSSSSVRLDAGFHSKEERELIRRPPKNMTPEQRAFRRRFLERQAERTGKEWCAAKLMGKKERAATPIPFRDLLLYIAALAI